MTAERDKTTDEEQASKIIRLQERMNFFQSEHKEEKEATLKHRDEVLRNFESINKKLNEITICFKDVPNSKECSDKHKLLDRTIQLLDKKVTSHAIYWGIAIFILYFFADYIKGVLFK